MLLTQQRARVQDGVHFFLRGAGDWFCLIRFRHARVEVLERLRTLGGLDGFARIERAIPVIEGRGRFREEECEPLSEEIRFALYVCIERFQSLGRARHRPNELHQVLRGVLRSRDGQSRCFRRHGISTHDSPETKQGAHHLNIVDAWDYDEGDKRDKQLRWNANRNHHAGVETTSKT